MTTLRFLQSLGSYLSTSDVATLTAQQRTAVVRAINEAVSKWAAMAPPGHRQFPFSAVFQGPSTVSVTVTNESRVVAGGFTAEDVGKTLAIDGDGLTNSLHTPTLLRLPYAGASGTVYGALHGDVVVLPTGFSHLASPVRVESASDSRELPRLHGQRYRTVWATTGRPEGYDIETNDSLAGGVTPRLLLRVYPLPTTREVLTVNYLGNITPWTLTDLLKARTVEVADEHWLRIEALVLRELLRTPLLLAETVDAKIIAEDARRAENDIRHARVAGAATMRIGTPLGY